MPVACTSAASPGPAFRSAGLAVSMSKIGVASSFTWLRLKAGATSRAAALAEARHASSRAMALTSAPLAGEVAEFALMPTATPYSDD